MVLDSKVTHVYSSSWSCRRLQAPREVAKLVLSLHPLTTVIFAGCPLFDFLPLLVPCTHVSRFCVCLTPAIVVRAKLLCVHAGETKSLQNSHAQFVVPHPCIVSHPCLSFYLAAACCW